MDIVTDATKPERYRTEAVCSYMQCVDAQEIRDGIARIFSDEVRATSPSDIFYHNVYNAAFMAYDVAENNTQKREVIITSLTAALEKEEDKFTFAGADKFLAERSKEYADSPQRKAALERMNIPAEKDAQ